MGDLEAAGLRACDLGDPHLTGGLLIEDYLLDRDENRVESWQLQPREGVDYEAWRAANYRVVYVGVLGSDFPSGIATETAAFGALGIVAVLAAIPIVDRRRLF